MPTVGRVSKEKKKEKKCWRVFFHPLVYRREPPEKGGKSGHGPLLEKKKKGRGTTRSTSTSLLPRGDLRGKERGEGVIGTR